MNATLPAVALMSALFIAGCNPGTPDAPTPGTDPDTPDNGGTTPPPTPTNQTPVASALVSADRLTGAGSVSMDASASTDADGDSLSYQWSQISPASPQAVIRSPGTAATQVDFANVATDTDYTFKVVVTDGQAADMTTINLTQIPAPAANQSPEARISSSASSLTGPGSLTLDGSASSDPDGDTLSYQWQQLQPAFPQATIANPTSENTLVTLADTSSAVSFTFQLTVRDDNTSDLQTTQITQQPTSPPTGGFTLPASQLRADESALTNSTLFTQVKASIATRNNTLVESISPLNGSNPDNVKRVESIISNSEWEFLFPRRAAEYTYTHFLQAIAKFPGFCASYTNKNSDAICRKALATMFAHFAQETGGHAAGWVEPEWRQGLFYLREVGWSETATNGYGICDPSTWQAQAWPCGTFSNGSYKSYFGRGAKQLSYNYNYGPFSQAMFGDVSVLLDNPERVADTWLNLASALFFFTYPQPPKPSMLHVIDGSWQPNSNDTNAGLVPGFGVTTQIINGGIECGGSNEHIQSQNRIDYYRAFANHLNVPVPADEVLGCANMQQFDAQGAGSLNIYWEQDYGWKADTPGNQAFACKLVSYQTTYSALIPDDYLKCVDHHFELTIDYSR